MPRPAPPLPNSSGCARPPAPSGWRSISSTRQITALDTDQGRVRQNLNSVDRDSDLHKRYMTKLAEQETATETLQAAHIKAEAARLASEKSVTDYLAKLDI